MDVLPSPRNPPDFVVVEYIDQDTGEKMKRKVYVGEMNGSPTLDLYSGWDPQNRRHKYPLTSLPISVCYLASLERLWLSHNQVSSLPPQISLLVNLRELFLHQNMLDSIPPELCRLRKLEILWLNSNSITAIPQEIAELKNLRRLHLDHNQIFEFPECLCELRGLEVLYLSHNLIPSISPEIANLKQLRRLYLQHNKITDIPKEVTELVSISTLLLDSNEILHLRREFQVFQNQREGKNATISVKNNPCVTTQRSQSKPKLSLSSLPPRYNTPLKSRRHSDQVYSVKPVPAKKNSVPESQLGKTMDHEA